jgi:DNA-binding response OmpR family regulator
MNPDSKGTILIVEDEQDLSDLLKEELEFYGYDVVAGFKFTDLFIKLDNQKFSCILLDLKLPGGAGTRVVDKIRANPSHPNFSTPVIITSAFVSPEVMDAYKTKIQGVLTKPYKIADILAHIDEAQGN